MIWGRDFVFVHVPKTGGKSVTQAITAPAAGARYPTHTPFRCIRPGHRRSFAFVRNPWARLVSLYRFMCQKPMRATDNFDQEYIRALGFKRWLMLDRFFMREDIEPQCDRPENWTGEDGLLLPMQIRPQWWWVDGVEKIGRFETIAEDFRRICADLGIEHGPLPHANRTEGRPWQDEYDDESRAFVALYHADDIERFGYAPP